ncbi:MAG: hypothetical protein MUF75_05650 [Bacteroidia bacterium]|nr:hypothetical protein [Bacteroidia bacterium]
MIGLIFLMFVLFCCKKKTSIEAKVYNYALAEPVANAKVVLVERKESGLFVSDVSCIEIASATTDTEGNCSFDKEKLKTGAKYTYYLAVAEAYGKAQDYPCGGKTSGFLEIGENQNQKLDVGGIEATLRIQFNNLLNPSQPGDSLIIGLSTIEYNTPKGIALGGGGVFSAFPYYNINSPPNFPAILLTEPQQTEAQRLKRYIRKRKLGVMTIKVDTIKVRPYETNTVVIDW